MSNMIVSPARKQGGCVYGCCDWDHNSPSRRRKDRRHRKHQNKRREARQWRSEEW